MPGDIHNHLPKKTSTDSLPAAVKERVDREPSLLSGVGVASENKEEVREVYKLDRGSIDITEYSNAMKQSGLSIQKVKAVGVTERVGNQDQTHLLLEVTAYNSAKGVTVVDKIQHDNPNDQSLSYGPTDVVHRDINTALGLRLHGGKDNSGLMILNVEKSKSEVTGKDKNNNPIVETVLEGRNVLAFGPDGLQQMTAAVVNDPIAFDQQASRGIAKNKHNYPVEVPPVDLGPGLSYQAPPDVFTVLKKEQRNPDDKKLTLKFEDVGSTTQPLTTPAAKDSSAVGHKRF